MIIISWMRDNMHKLKKVLAEKGLGMVSISPYYYMYQLPCVDNFFRVVSCQFLIPVFHSPFFSKTLDLTVAKNGSKEVNNTNFGFLMVKLMYVPLPLQHKNKQAFKIGFVYL